MDLALTPGKHLPCQQRRRAHFALFAVFFDRQFTGR